MISRTPEVRTGTKRLSLAEEQRRADDADRARRARQPRNGFPLSYLFRN